MIYWLPLFSVQARSLCAHSSVLLASGFADLVQVGRVFREERNVDKVLS